MNKGKIVTREEAIKLGKKYYYAAEICPICKSMGLRHTEDGECTYCRKARKKKEWNRAHKPARVVRECIQCPCGGYTVCITSKTLKDGARKSYQQCVECKRIWICRNGEIDGQRQRSSNKPKATIPGARVILGRCASGSD
jgi:hypothetical protein